MFLVDSHRRCLLDWMMRFYIRLKGRYVTCRWRNTWNQFFCSHKHHQQDLFKKICTIYIISLLASQPSRLLCRHHYQKDLFIWSRSPSFFSKRFVQYILFLTLLHNHQGYCVDITINNQNHRLTVVLHVFLHYYFDISFFQQFCF